MTVDPSRMGLVSSQKRLQRDPCHLYHVRTWKKEGTGCNPGRGPSPKDKQVGALILDLPSSEL